MFLLEAILAVVILTVTISVIIESLVSGLRATKITTDYSKSLLLADHMMAEVMRQRDGDFAFPDEDNFDEPYDEFRYAVQTEDILPQEADGKLKEVRMTVAWPSGRKEQKISIVTWLFPEPEEDKKSGPQ